MADTDISPEQQSAQATEHMRRLVEDWARAQVSLKQIVGLSEEELYAVANQGYILFLQGKTDEARVFFEGLVAIDPRNAYYYRALGTIYWRLKEPQRALKQFTYAIRVAPDEMTSYLNRAEVYVSTRQFENAESDIHQALARAQPGAESLVRKARAMLRMIPRGGR